MDANIKSTGQILIYHFPKIHSSEFIAANLLHAFFSDSKLFLIMKKVLLKNMISDIN